MTVLFALISGKTAAQQQISVDADSLWGVFMNYERCKVVKMGLKSDTLTLKQALQQMHLKSKAQEELISNLESSIIPALEEQIKITRDLADYERKRGRKKLFTGMGVGAGIALAAILIFGGQ